MFSCYAGFRFSTSRLASSLNGDPGNSEMIRLKVVRVFQQANFGPIRVYKRVVKAEGAPDFS